MSPADFAATAAGVLALIGILAAVWRAVRSVYRMARRLERIERLAQELAPNHGGSIKDTVHRLEAKVDGLTASRAEHADRIARAEGRIEAIALVTSPTMLIEDDEGVIREAKSQGRL